MPGTRALLTALLAAAATAVSAAPSHAAADWMVGNGSYQTGLSCVGMDSYYANQTISYAMFWTDPQAGYPAVGDKYYMQLQIGQSGSTCPHGIADVETEMILPSNTQLAIDPRSADKNDRVRCFYIDSKGKETEVTDFTWKAPWDGSITGKWCDSTKVPGRGTYGPHLGFRLLSQGTQFIVRVPVVSTARVAGMGAPGDTAKMAGVIKSGVNTQAVPFQWVTVFDRATSIAYPSAPVTGLSDTTASTTGTLNSWYRKGNVYVDLGTAASGQFTTTAGPLAIDGTYPQYTIKQDWGQLTPGTDYRWRVRFVDSSGVTTTGATQSFRTTGTAPAPGGGGGTGGGTPTPGGGGSTGGGSAGGGSTPPVDQGKDAGAPPAGEQQQPVPASAASVTPAPAPRATAPASAPGATASPAPVFKLGKGAKLGRTIPVEVTCPAACTAKATLKVDAKTAKKLGLKSAVLGTGTKAGKGKVTITVKTAKRLAKVKSVKATLTVALSTGGTGTTSVTLKR